MKIDKVLSCVTGILRKNHSYIQNAIDWIEGLFYVKAARQTFVTAEASEEFFYASVKRLKMK